MTVIKCFKAVASGDPFNLRKSEASITNTVSTGTKASFPLAEGVQAVFDV